MRCQDLLPYLFIYLLNWTELQTHLFWCEGWRTLWELSWLQVQVTLTLSPAWF